MNSSTIRQKAIEAAGTILIKQGYDWVDLDTIGKNLGQEVKTITSEFPNKALICEAWMEHNDTKARVHHEKLLKSGKAPESFSTTTLSSWNISWSKIISGDVLTRTRLVPSQQKAKQPPESPGR